MKITQSNLLNNFSNVTHAFTTKHGGTSQSPYISLNLAFHVGDNKHNVINNHDILAHYLSYNKNKLVHMKQIHSSIVHIVDVDNDFNNPVIADALITDKIDTPLMVMVADCSPILFYDNNKNVIAVAHAGRQGAFKNIIYNVIKSFQNNFDSNLEDIYVSIGASIGVCCYEVGLEIYNEAKKINLEFAIKKKDNKYYLNISKILLSQLNDCNINRKNIDISEDCNCCKNNKYFSYRAEGTTGRFSGVILLK